MLSPLVSINSKQLAEPLQHRLSAISLFANFARAGGLASYGPNLDEFYRETGIMAAKILKGIKPADLPAEREDRKVARSGDTADASGHRRRSDRVSGSTSACGT